MIRATTRAIAGASTASTAARTRELPPGASIHRSLMRPRYVFATASSRPPSALSRAVYAGGPTLWVRRRTRGNEHPTGGGDPGADRGGRTRTPPPARSAPSARAQRWHAPVEAGDARPGPAHRAAEARAPRQADGARGVRQRQPLLGRLRDRGDPEGGR